MKEERGAWPPPPRALPNGHHHGGRQDGPRGLTAPVRVRRAVTLLVLTLLVPGSAQLTSGNRRLGLVALRCWLAVLGLGLVLGLGWLVHRPGVLRLVTSPVVLSLAAAACYVLAVGWVALLVDAWRLGRPPSLPRRPRLLVSGLVLALVLATGLPLVAAGRRAWAAGDLIGSVFGDERASAAVDGRWNVLLLGGDAGPDRIGTRPDSMTLASIDASTGRTVLLSLPRNLENVPMPAGSPAAKALPKGWSCGDECLLNGLYQWGSEHRELFPGAKDPGAEAMKQAAQAVTGLTVNYYVLVDLKGFRQLIDAMGGVELTVAQRVPIGGGSSPVSGYIEPGRQRLDGYRALWFARSRHGADDYARMQRQRCVMDAMVQQMDPATLLRRFQDVAAAGKQVVSTDLPAGELATFIDLGVQAKSRRITSVQFVPPLIKPAFPDYGVIRARVAQAVDAAQEPDGERPQVPEPAAPAARGPATSAAAPAARPSAARPAPATPAPAPAVDDIRAACRVS